MTREFDVSHLSRTCEICDAFARFVNAAVLETFEGFEDAPPEDLDWERLDRPEKFQVAERIARHGHELTDFEVEAQGDGAET